jgi:outer membrane protein assembly factor BamB
VSGTGSNVCIGGDRLYVASEHRCAQLDMATGQVTGQYATVADASGQSQPWGYLAWSDGVLFGTSANPAHIVTYRYVARGGDMTRQLTESTHMFAIDTQSGQPLWVYPAHDSLRHNAIAVAAGKVFLIDRPQAVFDRVKKPASKEHPPGKLVALDARTGQVLWENADNIYGTVLAASAAHGIVLMCYQPTAFRLDSEVGGRMAAFGANDGKRLWDIEAKYESRPTINDRTIYVQGGAWDLLTGQPVPFDFKRSYGCGILASSQRMLVFRSATLGYFDLSGARTTENYGGIRPGCWINALPVGGLVLLPDATAGCECSYLNKSWIALAPLGK